MYQRGLGSLDEVVDDAGSSDVENDTDDIFCTLIQYNDPVAYSDCVNKQLFGFWISCKRTAASGLRCKAQPADDSLPHIFHHRKHTTNSPCALYTINMAISIFIFSLIPLISFLALLSVARSLRLLHGWDVCCL